MLLGADVYLDGSRVEGHMWTGCRSGIEIDLTREHFKGGELVGAPLVRERTAAVADPSHPRYHRYEMYLLLAERVRTRLATSDA